MSDPTQRRGRTQGRSQDELRAEVRGTDQGVERPWLRLHPLTTIASIVFVGAIIVGAGVATAAAMIIGGISAGWTVFWVAVGVIVTTLVIAVAEIIRVRAMRYRITGGRLQLRVKFIASSTRSLPLNRIRTIDLTADLAQRWLGLTSVRFGTGDQSGSRFALTSLGRADAEQLRHTLLGGASTSAAGGRAGVGRLATFDPAWIRYAPVSLAVPVLGAAAFGAVVQVADWFNGVPQLWGYVSAVLAALALPLQILVLALLALAIGMIASIAIFVEAWWGYRLDREADGTVHVQRGLLVRRTSSFSGARIRGVILDEPLGYRRVGAAKLRIIAIGLQPQQSDQSQQRDSSAIVPAAPRRVATDVAEAITGGPAPTRRYPRGGMALFGLLVLAVIPPLVWLPELWFLVAGLAVAGLPITWWLVRDNVRGLGHRITADQVVIRTGSVFRQTVVLDRAGILGWNLRQSPAQLRLRLVTLIATSAAHPGHFRLPDLDPAEAPMVQRTAGPVWEHLWVLAAPPSADSPSPR